MKPLALIRFAWKNLWAHRMRAMLTIGGVTLGVGAIVFLVSLGYGLERLVTNQVANFDAFTIIDVPSANLKTGKINQDGIARIKTLPHVTSIDPIVDLAGRIRLATQNATAEMVTVAANPSYFKLAELPIEGGRLFTQTGKDEAVINKSLAGLLGFTDPKEAIGASVVVDLIVAEDLRPRDSTEGPLVKADILLTIVGLTNENPNPILYVPLALADAQGVTNRTSLKVKIDNRDNVEVTRKAIENIGFSTEYVGDTVAQIAQVFSLFRLVLGGFGAIALIVAALGTFNTLTISLMERVREVGLLKTLGMKRKDIFRVFITESLTIGLLGGMLGILLGVVIGTGLNVFLRALADRVEADPVSVFSLSPAFILVIAVGSLVVGFLTGFYPAYRAIKTNPLDVLRYE